jgi:hypothetical protein
VSTNRIVITLRSVRHTLAGDHLEGGRKDSNGGGRQHPAMAAALKEKGYAYQWLDTTEGTHGGLNGNTTFPEGLIWLWKGWKSR